MLFCTTSNRLHVFTRFVLISGILLLFTSVIPDIACAQKVDPELKPYEPVGGEVAGSLKGVGSDTMNNLMALWTEGFKNFYPSVREGIEGKGSSSAPPALMEGTSTFGPMSRPWKPSEIDAFKDHFGYPPTVIPSAIDMLAVYVHKDNPIKGLSLQQVDAIFSKNRNGGMKKPIMTWGELGLTGEWQDKPISLYGRNSASGTYGYFKEHALFKGDFKSTVKEQPGSSSVVQSVASDKYGIGYSGIGYKTADVLAIPIGASVDGELIAPEASNAYSGAYPLSRFLYLSVNYKPGSELEPLRREFLKYVLSATGQGDVLKDGYLPVTQKIAQKSLISIGVE
ncbi:MAG: phosphate ABC transporter substrate-binding protein [Planctomycetes bacterium]|nr:phosphate ABC transporter substrate-binding protein [Planctomycetota bacterium]MBL6909926.1 phosphate ABC transporter substrate-binding protein [Pirellulales bacterium]MBL7181487.1 phosphate ABC transporter substrate-binding protein [Pirellulales bacterium]